MAAELALVTGFVGIFVLFCALYLTLWVLRQPAGNAKMNEIAAAIQEGASAYLARQYKTLVIFVVVIFGLIGFFVNWLSAGAFFFGVLCSALAGYVGMIVSVRANVRAAKAAEHGLADALKLAFRGGSVTGLTLVGLG
ncbi:MAG: sodium/proton-translocating pyrophosphatase, partial [Candidatus Micrarchaeota archaeon]